ncbi:DUF1194 domain-containing protein [Marinovum algicola]|uniref:DUF1194 domain-containing protein n=1 Tax=Marinovum algicola TaxID=42444 RepID=UPI0024B8BF0F|nr:DUF1194 domain-containing protein [Marinovum algicola]
MPRLAARLWTTRLLTACLLALWAGAAAANCRLALVLAVDVSASVNASEHQLQRQGLAAALTDDAVAEAILEGSGPVALAIFEWSGRQQQQVLQDWLLLDSAEDLTAVADRVRRLPRSYSEFPTAMGYALGFAAGLLQRAPVCLRQVVDVSGDGITNEGFRPQLAYRHFPFDGVTVNGLVVTGDDTRVVPYYRQEVLRGRRAFLEEAQGFEGFEAAMTRKLYRETRELVLGVTPQR